MDDPVNPVTPKGVTSFDEGGICLVDFVEEPKGTRTVNGLRGQDMRYMMRGFSGWMTMKGMQNESIKVVDTAITVVATLLVATTVAVLHVHI
jgi:hypothetical protein